MRTILLLGLCLAACAPGSVADNPEGASDGASLTNAVVDQNHPEVAELLWLDTTPSIRAGVCTVTTILPTVVLTAAHCVYQMDTGMRHDTTTMRIVFNGDLNHAVHVTRAIPDPAFNPSAIDVGHDIAVLHLDRNAPYAEAWLGAAPQVGDYVTMVGFGAASEKPGAAGQQIVSPRMTGGNNVSSVRTRSFEIAGAYLFDSNICHGDSGGPAFVDRDGYSELVGVAVLGTCDNQAGAIPVLNDTNWGGFVRVDAASAFINSASAS